MKFFKLITFFTLFLLCNALEAQTFIYSYTDPCTGLLKSMDVPSNGVTVTYFGQIQTFQPQDFQTGVFDNWAEGVYNSFGGANPCGSIFGVSTSVDIAQSTAINFISIINNISALADLQSAMNGGGSLNTMSAIESAKNSSKKKDKKKTETTTTQSGGQNSQSQSNSETNPTEGQTQNSDQSNQTNGSTNTGSDQNVQLGQTNGSTNTENGQNSTSGNTENQSGGENNTTNSNQNTTSQNSQSGTENNQTNSNSQNGSVTQNEGQNTGGSTTTGENSQSTEGGPVNSTGQLNQTLTQSTDIGSGSGSGSSENQTTQNSQTTTTGENSTTTTEQPNSQSGQTSNNTESGTENTQQTNTTTENNSQNTTGQEPNSETGQNGQTTNSENSQTGENSTQTTNNEGSQSPTGENSQTQNDPNQNGQSSNSNGNSGGNGVGGESPNSNDNAAQNSEDKKTNFLGGTVKSVERSTESNKPQIVLSSDFAGFNFRSGEVDFGGKGTAGYTSLSWDGRRTYGVLLDYTSIIRGPNITGFYANITKKRIDLVSLTGTFSFYGRGSQYGSLAVGQMWNLNKSKSLKAIYMATASFGNVYGEQFLGTAFIAGGMYDWRVHKRVDVKLMNLFIYAPYVSYYNDILLKSPYVIMPIVGTNIGITKKFKFNVNFGGAYAINENVMNFTLMFGTRLAL